MCTNVENAHSGPFYKYTQKWMVLTLRELTLKKREAFSLKPFISRSSLFRGSTASNKEHFKNFPLLNFIKVYMRKFLKYFSLLAVLQRN